jgi:hypothetical protein
MAADQTASFERAADALLAELIKVLDRPGRGGADESVER